MALKEPENYNKLYFNAVSVNEKDGSITVKPNFLCPKCGNQAKPETRPTAQLSTSAVAVSKLVATDVKGQSTFTMPCCGTKITLYTAIYKALNGAVQNCVSVEPINLKWFELNKEPTKL